MELTLILIFKIAIVVLLAILIAIPISIIYAIVLVKIVEFIDYLEKKNMVIKQELT